MQKEGGKKEKFLELQGRLSYCNTMAELRAKCLSIPWGLGLIRWHIAGLILDQLSLSSWFFSGIMKPRKRLEGKPGIYLFKCFLFMFLFTLHCTPSQTHLYKEPENLVAPAASEERLLNSAQRRPITCLVVWVGFIWPVFAKCKLPWRAHNPFVDLIWYTCTYDGNSTENKSWV